MDFEHELNDRLQDLSDRLRETALAPHLDGPHTEKGVLYYHYTSADGLRAILEDGDLRATNIFYLNDPSETTYGQTLCRHFLYDELPRCEKSHFGTFIDACRKTLSLHSDDLYPYDLQYVTCFTLDGDLLSQWRGYTDCGKGFSLGFSNKGLLDSLFDIGADTDEAKQPRPIPMRMLYNKDEQLGSLRSVLKVVEDEWARLEPHYLANDDTRSAVNVMAALWLATASTCFKDAFFAEEREVRVLYANVREMKVADTKLDVNLRIRDHDLIPYRRLGLSREGKLLPLRQIIVGPGLNFDHNKRALEMYLHSRGYGEAMPEIVSARGSIK